MRPVPICIGTAIEGEGAPAMSLTNGKTSIKVWDPVVRFGHWSLVAAFAVAYLSAEEEGGSPDQLHVWGGYVVGVILAIRLVWGLVGTQHARFSDFVYSPASTLQYLTSFLQGHPRRYLGHSPAGAAMIFALMFCLAATVGTGLVAYGDSGKGPLANAGDMMITVAQAEEHERASELGSARGGEGKESAVGEIHGVLANVTLGLVILHILGVGLSSVLHRENLVAAMFNGRKRAGDES
jgi:cytochrome b